MPETVLPGTYIEVRDEGLITPGRITTGNIGIVGTASRGEMGKVVLLSGRKTGLLFAMTATVNPALFGSLRKTKRNRREFRR